MTPEPRSLKDITDEICRSRGILKRDLARELGVSPSLVSHFRSGKRVPNDTALSNLARLAGETPEVIQQAIDRHQAWRKALAESGGRVGAAASPFLPWIPLSAGEVKRAIKDGLIEIRSKGAVQFEADELVLTYGGKVRRMGSAREETVPTLLIHGGQSVQIEIRESLAFGSEFKGRAGLRSELIEQGAMACFPLSIQARVDGRFPVVITNVNPLSDVELNVGDPVCQFQFDRRNSRFEQN